MKGIPAIYLGQIVDKKHFRTFVYSMDGSKKLVESWDQYEKHMESGLWFSTQEDAKSRVPVEKPKRVRNKPVAAKPQELEKKDDEPLIEEELIRDDDFLPKTGE
jgi:hypothetical protein